jgi:hypothetical protein
VMVERLRAYQASMASIGSTFFIHVWSHGAECACLPG